MLDEYTPRPRSRNGVMHDSIEPAHQGWGRDDVVAFYSAHRSKVEDLYLSERLVLPAVASRAKSVLDFGCSTGGFVEVFRHFNSEIRYTGADIAGPALKAALSRYPGVGFIQTDGAALPLRDRSHELVWSTGVLHMNETYQKIVSEAWRVADRWMLCDFRLSIDGLDHRGRIRIDFGGGKDEWAEAPYLVLAQPRLVDFLSSLTPCPAAISIVGYPHETSPLATAVPSHVVMAFALVERGARAGGRPVTSIDVRPRSEFAPAF
jgi:SAM-dependent methyltransferase